MAALTGGALEAPLLINGFTDNPALDPMPSRPVGPTWSESTLSGWEYEYNKAWSASGGVYDPFNDAQARMGFAANREYIKWLDRVADAQLAQDFRDFGGVYYQTASTLVAPVGMADTAYQILSGKMTAAEAAVALATVGKGRLTSAMDRVRSPSFVARSEQGGRYYPGVDRFRDITLKKGTVIYAGEPGATGFATTSRAISRTNLDGQRLFEGLQVRPLHGTYRPGVTQYVITQDTPAAFGIVRANSQYGPGGLPQLFIPNFKAVTQPVVSYPLMNRSARIP